MSGIWDGVSKVWTMEHDRGLRMDGFKTKVEAAVSLVRQEMLRDSSDSRKAEIRAAMEDALSFMDDERQDPATIAEAPVPIRAAVDDRGG